MSENRICINIESSKYSVVIRSDVVSKVKIILPMFASLSSNFMEEEAGIYNLKISEDVNKFRWCNDNVKYGFSLNPISKKIIVIVPNYYITNLNLVLQDGKSLLEDLILNKCEINTGKGNVIIKNSHSQLININSKMADVKLIRVNGTNSSIYTDTGNIDIIDNDFNKIMCKTEKGDIYVNFLKHELKRAKIYVYDGGKLLKNDAKTKKIEREYIFTTNHGKFKSNMF